MGSSTPTAYRIGAFPKSAVSAQQALRQQSLKINADELTFTGTIEVAIETKNAAKFAKEIVSGLYLLRLIR